MSNVLTFPNSFVRQVDGASRNGRITAFARKLVDEFYVSLPGEVREFPSDERVFLVGSWEDLMTADEDVLFFYQKETGRTGKQLLNLAFDENLTARCVETALTFREEETREALVAVLRNLRLIDLDGLDPRSEQVLDESVAHLEALLTYALLVGRGKEASLVSEEASNQVRSHVVQADPAPPSHAPVSEAGWKVSYRREVCKTEEAED
ncbi:hypothetical protein ASG19_14055 [Rhizobium sp. Leaf306]|uniref:hypothetical protein n=1 Tax=Rhizobium sp. Leaf306 TaxID=1736330 RepID=UPI0007147E3C|nr:hypothetical protein [Rhizobium sp. Leaf306]KQQ34883.1 hypothetical protein ASG19_14055 [Rhizobium sp. Leaf306]